MENHKNKRRNFRPKLLNKKMPHEKVLALLLVANFPYVFQEQFYFSAYRQNFYIDFWFPHYRFAVELDGGIHERKIEYDSIRAELIASVSELKRNILPEILRFNNEDLEIAPLFVVDSIKKKIEERRNLFARSPGPEDLLLMADAEKYESQNIHYLTIGRLACIKHQFCCVQCSSRWFKEERLRKEVLDLSPKIAWVTTSEMHRARRTETLKCHSS